METSANDYVLLGEQQVRLRCVHDCGNAYLKSVPELLLKNAIVPCAFHFAMLHCTAFHRSLTRGLSDTKVACSVHGIRFQDRGAVSPAASGCVR